MIESQQGGEPRPSRHQSPHKLQLILYWYPSLPCSLRLKIHILYKNTDIFTYYIILYTIKYTYTMLSAHILSNSHFTLKLILCKNFNSILNWNISNTFELSSSLCKLPHKRLRDLNKVICEKYIVKACGLPAPFSILGAKVVIM